jgi:molecular chaperone DnaK
MFKYAKSIKSFYTNYKKFFSLLGIDMGGTNTVITIMEANGPRVIENAEGLRTTPSCVSVNENGSEVVAVVAKRQVISMIIL